MNWSSDARETRADRIFGKRGVGRWGRHLGGFLVTMGKSGKVEAAGGAGVRKCTGKRLKM
jgi:hypothetical protein